MQAQLYNKLRKDIDIRFEVKKVEKTSDKIFVLVQVWLSLFKIRFLCLSLLIRRSWAAYLLVRQSIKQAIVNLIWKHSVFLGTSQESLEVHPLYLVLQFPYMTILAALDVGVAKKDGAQVKNGLEL